jgi:hypothetical protein
MKTWVKNEREEKLVRGAPNYIVPTHKDKHMGLKRRLGITLSPFCTSLKTKILDDTLGLVV